MQLNVFIASLLVSVVTIRLKVLGWVTLLKRAGSIMDLAGRQTVVSITIVTANVCRTGLR